MQETGQVMTLNLDDDPQALEMAIQYLYHLDYPVAPIAPPAPLQNGVNGHLSNHDDDDETKLPNGHDVESNRDAETKTEASAEPLDDFLPPAPKKPKKKKKKKPAAKPEGEEAATEHPGDTPVDPAADPPVEATEETPAPGKLDWDEQMAAEEANAAKRGPSEEPVNGVTGQAPSQLLAVHAKVYGLSKKYSIDGLRSLSLGKFSNEATDQWDTEDFLDAAREVYSAPAEDKDRSMKDILTEIVFQHPEMLSKGETQQVIRGLGLDWDVLMLHHNKNLLGPPTPGTAMA
jgi:hypothetical protein